MIASSDILLAIFLSPFVMTGILVILPSGMTPSEEAVGFLFSSLFESPTELTLIMGFVHITGCSH